MAQPQPGHDACWVPEWPAPESVRACMTTRVGGHSVAPFDGWNLGDHVGDAPEAVAANRRALEDALGVRPVFLRQVHGVHCEPLVPTTSDGTVADAAATRERGLACTVMVADCLPVLFTDAQGHWVAAAHAGWRGLVGLGAPGACGVLDTTVAAYTGSLPEQPPLERAGELMAWLGPCIGPQAFEVGAEVRSAFLDAWRQPADGAVAQAFLPVPERTGQFWCNLPALARWRLGVLGLSRVYGNDGSAAWCTAGQPDRWFSHRRDAQTLGSTGRMAACIWRV